MKNIVFILLAACGQAPAGALCPDVSTDAEILSCTVKAINTHAACELLTLHDQTIGLPSGHSASVAFVDTITTIKAGKGLIVEGLTSAETDGKFDIQIVNQDYRKYYEVVDLTHELGHALGLRYADNPTDIVHSATPSDVMYYESPSYLSDDNLKAFVAQVEAQGLGCH